MKKQPKAFKGKEATIQEEEEPLKFYNKNQEGYYLSNFYPSPFSVNGKIYKTNEHYFQSKKHEGLPQEQLVIDAKTPGAAFKLGRDNKCPKRKDWDVIKEDIMYEGLLLKFTTHQDLKAQLLSTKSRKLIEHTFKDSYWADGGDGSGKNRLGILLMKLRTQLQKQKEK